MKILIVDDDYEKVQKISEFISEVAGHESIVLHETTAVAARLEVRNNHFDLVLIDVNLPSNVGATPAGDGGFRLFDMLSLDKACPIPGEILFISAIDNTFEKSRADACERGATLCEFEHGNDSWKIVLRGKINIALRRAAGVASLRCDVAMITALARPELEAVLSLPYQFEKLNIPSDPTTYYKGGFTVRDQHISVIAASAVKKGMASSAALATKMVLSFRPKLLVMTGICAGVEDKTNLGDVIVGDPTWDWGSGKHAEENDGSPVFRLSPVQRPLNTHLSQLSAQLAMDDSFKCEVRSKWTHDVPAGALNFHVGPMASGASVLADKSTLNEIVAQNRDVIAVEMEAFAVMAACEFAFFPPPIAVAIKSVCDFANSSKVDDWQRYAAFTSAMFADKLLKSYFFENA